jgi:SAM-dependent methyltransferase
LVEINADALKIAKQVFRNYASQPRAHRFSCSSVFDYDDQKKYDFVFAIGSLHHTNQKERAFSIISSFLKPNGFLVLGMSSPIGGFQNNLQRIICYRFAKTDEEIVEIAERLYKDDIDRSQIFGKRTRRGIIYDRWVVPKQDDPTAKQVIEWFRANGLRFYHSYPPILLPVLADSAGHRPRFELRDQGEFCGWTEAFWLSHEEGDAAEVPASLRSLPPFSRNQSKMARFINNIEPNTYVDFDEFESLIGDYLVSLSKLDFTQYLKQRQKELLSEVLKALKFIRKRDLDGLAKYLSGVKHLFRGMNGLRNVYYVGWKS